MAKSILITHSRSALSFLKPTLYRQSGRSCSDIMSTGSFMISQHLRQSLDGTASCIDRASVLWVSRHGSDQCLCFRVSPCAPLRLYNVELGSVDLHEYTC